VSRRDLFPSALLDFARICRRIRHLPLNTNNILAFAFMSHSNPTASSSNHFQLLINNALKAYEKRTKNDLLSHPLATQLQDCNSPADILAVLHQQIQGPSQSRSTDNRWTKWLDSTVNILYTLSETLGEGVSLVSQM
jgi:fungal STAND N-terminal Goodbye domain